MGITNIHQKIIENLYITYHDRGYVTENSVLEKIIENKLSLEEVDYICGHLLAMGVIINNESSNESDEDEDGYDRSQTDYDKLFDEVVKIDENLAPFIDEIRLIKPPQHREWQNLIPQAKSNNQFAKQRVIEMYLRTVIRIALWHHQKYQMPLAETIQEGCVGLVIALDKYEMSKQDNFSTYAPWWIRQKIIRDAPALNPLVYVPVHVKDKLFSIYDIIEQHYCNYCEANQICPQLINEVTGKLNCNQKEAAEYIQYFHNNIIWDSILELGESDSSDNGLFESQMVEEYSKDEAKEKVAEMLKTIKPREETVLLQRFGFIDGEVYTLEQIGDKFGLTRERIRQIEAKALRKLRHPIRSKKLRCFIE